MQFTFSKNEKLTSRTLFDGLFAEGTSLKAFPFSLKYMEAPVPEGVDRQVAIVVPKRGLKRAVDRNRTKRQIRELYRLHKHKINRPEKSHIWSIRYLGNRTNDYAFLEKGFLALIEAYNQDNPNHA
jgi:ribonuclease P protein component